MQNLIQKNKDEDFKGYKSKVIIEGKLCDTIYHKDLRARVFYFNGLQTAYKIFIEGALD